MIQNRKPFNPFYILLVVTGVAFCVTAFAFGVMTVRGLHASAELMTPQQASASGQQFMAWLDKNGFRLMMSEIGVLGVFTVAAIGTDEYWTKRQQRKREAETEQ